VRDVSEAHQRWPSLQPRLDVYTSDTGHSQNLVILRGTIPIKYRGVSYNIPVEIMVMSYHPNGPPKMYVKPTQNMEVKQRHDHVDRNGLIYLPYLTTWDPIRSSLIGGISAMIEVFSRIPPVYAVNNSSSGGKNTREQNLANLTARCTKRFQEISDEATNDAIQLLSKRDAGSKNAVQISKLKQEKEHLEKYIKDFNVTAGDIDVDTMIHPRNTHAEQIMQCLAKDSALDDALAQIEDAKLTGVIDLETFMRETSRLAREQFFARALLRKVKMHQAHGVNGNTCSRKNISSSNHHRK